MGRVLQLSTDLLALAGGPNTSVFAHRSGAVIRQLVDSSNARICLRYSLVTQFGSASNRTARSTSKCAPRRSANRSAVSSATSFNEYNSQTMMDLISSLALKGRHGLW